MKRKSDYVNRIKQIEREISPLDQRSGKRLKPGQKSDAVEQLLFIESESIDCDSDLEPDYIKKLKLRK